MVKDLLRNGSGPRSAHASKYDAQNTVLSKTYGALADLRRELADSKAVVAEREELLRSFATCADSQRAWLLLEDYFERLSLSRKDFPNTDWWPRLLAAQGQNRLEEVAFLFLRAQRSLPTELGAYANLDRFAQVEQAAQEQQLVRHLEAWLFPHKPAHFDAPRAFVRALCRPLPDAEQPGRYRLAVELHLSRPRTGEKVRRLGEIIELTTRAAHEQELFPPRDWEFIQWLAETHSTRRNGDEVMVLSDLELLHWLARWGDTHRLELAGGQEPPPALEFRGEVAELTPHLENGQKELAFTHRLTVPGGKAYPLSEVRFFNHHPPLALVERSFCLLRNAPPPPVLELWARQPAVPMRQLSHRLLMHLRQTQSRQGVDWEQLCVAHGYSRKSTRATHPGSNSPTFGEGNHPDSAQERLWNRATYVRWTTYLITRTLSAGRQASEWFNHTTSLRSWQRRSVPYSPGIHRLRLRLHRRALWRASLSSRLLAASLPTNPKLLT